MENIYLVGFMGTGKTAVGKELAKKKKLQFVDLDELIEFREKRAICDIFAKEGEPYFRKVEKRVLREVSREKKFVVACGGGIVLDKDNIKIMKETGILICLTATPQVILERTAACSHRPLLNVKDPKKQIELLLKFRAPYYAEADKTINTSKISVKEVVEKILRGETRKLKAGFMYIELLLVLAIIMFIASKVFNLYFNKSPLNKETQRVISTQGIDTASSQSIVSSTKKKLQDIQSQENQRMNELGNIK